MPFKEDVTTNIYNRWPRLIRGGEKYGLRELNDFNIPELQELKWLIEQELESRNKRA